ncbi:MAG: FAD-dependent oxidoreductase [candidate division Zixibacteria bacterium]|nr:FAD-dependent oxidoreductase [candidate division Zixibacteria bacterium]MDH3937043.1 FAD-dependent oxidoreductase [candidate division Zixibacteria bacterium]MDH4035210.1 FAD-dependent oxidoreductase [candidate division Zixibacteria bacterium]
MIVDGKQLEAPGSQSLLSTLLDNDIYVPHICHHPALPACDDDGCGLCVVQVNGDASPVRACRIASDTVSEVTTDSVQIREARQRSLAKILTTHPHACLTCSDAEGCTRTSCTQNVEVPERCCSLFGNCQLQDVAAYIGIPDFTPRYKSDGLPKVLDEPFYNFDYNLCIACTRCIRACRDVKKVDALKLTEEFGRPVAIPKSGRLKESGCIFCGLCIEVCPTGAMMDKPFESDRKEDAVVPCRATCPAEIDVPLYVRLVAQKRYGEAVAVIREKAPIPGILGRVCYNPCEQGCRRKTWDEPVAIRSLKRFAADHDDGHWKSQLVLKDQSGKRVAVVGAGPAGLTASYYLRLSGHQVDLYDRMKKPGGMLRYGIPRFRLPEEALQIETQAILDLGVTFHPQSPIDSPDELSGFDAVFWATGAARSVALAKGSQQEDIAQDGLELLQRINDGEKIDLSGRVAVIGGGNVATDVARSARRLGADKVTIVYRRTRDEMPAYENEIDEALAEGIEMRFLHGPVGVKKENGHLSVTLQKMQLGEADSSGRRSPVPIEGSTTEMQVDHVVAAIGQRVETLAKFGVTTKGTIEVSPLDSMTSREGVFAGGDNVSGPSSVVAAVEAGRLVAQAVDRYLGGDGELPAYGIAADKDPAASQHATTSLQSPHCLLVEKRDGFDEIEQGYDDTTAVAQASRCSRCDLRLKVPAVQSPPEGLDKFNQDGVATVPTEAGVLLLYDHDKNVVLVAGAENMQALADEKLQDGFDADFLSFEPHQMYTQRESEMLSQHLQKHGSLPTGNDLDDELF